MAYQRPTCDCGGDLIHVVDKLITGVIYEINKDGTLRKRPSNPEYFSQRYAISHGFGLLECRECLKTYEFDMDLSTKKVLRGELI